MGLNINPIGIIRGGRNTPEDDNWGESICLLELDNTSFGPDALAGLSDFSRAKKFADLSHCCPV